MNYSISSFMYYRYPLLQTIRKVAALGYRGIEVWGGRPHAYAGDLNGDDCAEIRKVLADEGLSLPCFIPAQFRYPTNLACSEPKVRAESVAYLCRSAELAAKLGAACVSVCPGYTFYGEDRRDGWRRLRDSLAEILRFTKDLSLEVVLEPAHSMETDLVLTVADGLEMVAELDNPQLGLLPDTGHLFINKEPMADTLAMVAQRSIPFHIQVDDNHGVSDDHLVPGEGKIDWVDVYRGLGAIGYQGFLGVELGWGYTCDPDPAAARALKALREWERCAAIREVC